MSKRTLLSCWKQYELLARNLLDDDKDRAVTLKKLQLLTDKTNKDQICHALFTLFIKPYSSRCNDLLFTVDMPEDKPAERTSFDEEKFVMYVNPVRVLQFIDELKAVRPAEKLPDFMRYRYTSLLVELSKLTSLHVLFLTILQRVAYLLEIARLEKRGGVIEVADDEAYHTLLWAFKELEVFLKKTYGMNIRAHYGISWYESEWITGK